MIELTKLEEKTDSGPRKFCGDCGITIKLLKVSSTNRKSDHLILCESHMPKEWKNRKGVTEDGSTSK